MRAVKICNNENLISRMPSSLTGASNPPNLRARAELRKIALPTMEGINFEKISDIVSLEARGNYTYIFFRQQRKLLVCKTLREMEELIGKMPQFVRIHRSFTINLNLLQKYVKGKGGYVVMEDGSNISVSTGKKQDFLDALKIYFSQ